MTDQPLPGIGEIVIYRSRDHVDMAALVTGHAADRGLHLKLFPPPGEQPDVISYQWGAQENDDQLEPRHSTWRRRPLDPLVVEELGRLVDALDLAAKFEDMNAQIQAQIAGRRSRVAGGRSKDADEE